MVERMRLLSKFEVCQLKGMSSEQLVQGGFCDVVRLFVKNEPHSKKKIEEGRLRLISSVSLVDNLVERILFSRQNSEEISQWENIPSKPGLGLDEDEQLQAIYKSVEKSLNARKLAESDVTGWDWSVQDWELERDAEARVRLSGAATNSTFARLVRNRMFCLSRKVFYLSDGRMFAQRYDGVMASGSYVTGSSNSRMRVMAAYDVGSPFAIAIGDDSLEDYVVDAEVKYARNGHPLKAYSLCKNGFEFCSHRFTSSTDAKPVNWSKSLYRLLSRVRNEEEINQFVHFLRKDRESLEISRWVAQRVGWGPIKLRK